MSEAANRRAVEQTLKWMLRLIGTSSLLALAFVALPHSVFDSIHGSLGMGSLPSEPVVGYLARSTSAFYALLGGLFWLISFNVQEHRRVLTYLGLALPAFGLTLLLVDWAEGMPFFWTVWEGPFIMAFGLAIYFLNRRLHANK